MSQWIVSVNGQTYGPYTASQMQSFAVEGRLNGQSLIAKEPEGRFILASQDAELGFLFSAARPGSAAAANSASAESHQSFGQKDGESTEETAHFLIVADMKSGSITGLEEEILKLGPAYAVMPQAWVLSCTMSVGTLRNTLVHKLGKLDTLLVVDASNDKLSWSNLGMEAETKLRRIWNRQPQLSAA